MERCSRLPERIPFVLEGDLATRIHEDLSHRFVAP
jgi:hypothetical protein